MSFTLDNIFIGKSMIWLLFTLIVHTMWHIKFVICTLGLSFMLIKSTEIKIKKLEFDKGWVEIFCKDKYNVDTFNWYNSVLKIENSYFSRFPYYFEEKKNYWQKSVIFNLTHLYRILMWICTKQLKLSAMKKERNSKS